jgi:hypothetical protein
VPRAPRTRRGLRRPVKKDPTEAQPAPTRSFHPPTPAHPRASRLTHPLRRLALAALLATAGALAFTSAPALAATGHGFSAAFGPGGVGSGTFGNVQGVTVDQTTHDVFVYDDAEGGRVYKFDSAGAPVDFSSTGTNAIENIGSAGSDEEEVAIDSSSGPDAGDIYVANNSGVRIYAESGAFLGELSGGEMCGVAVGPSGDVYVGIYPETVKRYAPSANPVTNGDEDGSMGGLATICNIAVDGVGDVYAAKFTGGVTKFGALQFGSLSASGELVDTAGTSLAVDPISGEAFIDESTDVAQYTAAGVRLSAFGGLGLHALTGSVGVAIDDSSSTLYVGDGSTVDIFTPGPTPEAPNTTEPPGAITGTSARLEGELNPKGATGALEYQFDYNKGASCAGGQSVPVPAGALGEAKEALVEANATGLEPSTKYTYCLVASSFGVAQGNEVPFETKALPPTVAEPPSISVAPTEAHLEGLVNPNNQSTKCELQYEAEEPPLAAPTTVSCPETLEGYGNQGSLTISGLTQHTTYYFRVIAKNAGNEETKGTIEHFTTITPEPPETLPASEIEATGTEATLNGVLNPKHEGEVGTYEFVYRQSATECEHEGTVEKAAPSPAATAPATFPFRVSEKVTGLQPAKTYTYCLLAHTSQGDALGSPQTFTTAAIPPTIESESESATNIGSSSSTLHASINPGGAPTSYYFEYGPSTPYAAKTPIESAGAGIEAVGVLANLEGLEPGTTYYYRLIATNTKGNASGVDATFSTFPTGQLGLPDERRYELASTFDSPDATATPVQPQRAAANGAAVAFSGTSANEGGNGNNGFPGGQLSLSFDQSYLARRSSSGWSVASVQPPGLETVQYETFSSDLSLALLTSEQPLVAGAPSGDLHASLYSRDDGDGSYQLIGEHANYGGATPDGSQILVSANGDLYDSSAGTLYPVNVLPEGGTGSDVTFGSTGDKLHFYWSEGNDLEHVISANGSRIFWNTREEAEFISTEGFPDSEQVPKALYVRENATSHPSPLGPHGECVVRSDACTIQLDVSELPGTQKEKEEKGGGGRFWGASSDGSKVFFTDEHQLTENADVAPNEPDLYLYNFAAPQGERLTDLTTKTRNPGEHANVQGILGTSENGAYVYFAAAGALTEHSTPHACDPVNERGPSTLCNVYAVHEGEPPKLVAIVTNYDGEGGEAGGSVIGSGADRNPEEKSLGDWVPDIGTRSAHVTPDGRRLVVESVENLTGFNSQGGREIYTYDFETSRTSCVSCNPSGTPTLDGGPYRFLGELPQSFNETYAPRDLSTNGNRIFFETKEGLVSSDANGRPDVYEWEAPGEGSCAGTSSSYSTANGGCLYDLSGGTSTDTAYFVDASENGNDVFIESRADLVPQDKGEAFQVFDVRVGAPTPPAEPECTGSGCQGVAPGAPQFSTPATSTFSGGNGNYEPVPPSTGKAVNPCTTTGGSPSGKCTKAENLKKALTQCHKDKKKAKKKTCEAAARKKYGAKAKKASGKTHRKAH